MTTVESDDGAGDTAPGPHHISSPQPGAGQFRPRACQNCARSKLKCNWPAEPGVGTCTRCAKMNFGCVLTPLINRKRRGPSTRVRKLEDKLDGIMTLLSAVERSAPRPHDHHGDESSQRRLTPSSSSLATPIPPAVTGTPSTPPQPEAIHIVPDFALSSAEADAILNLYRTSYVLHCPFVPIPVTAAAAELEHTSPFLLRTILQAVAPQSAAVQKSVDRWFRQTVAQRVVVEQERSLELLQALLVFIAWGDFQFYIESQATDLLHLASTVVLDLALHKAAYPHDAGRPSFLPDAIRKLKSVSRPGHTLDDMRAMLGFFYLNSVVSTLFQRTASSLHTSYLSHCCDVLLSANEHDSDKFLVALVQMQRLLSRVASALPSPELDDQLWSMNGSTYMTMVTARKELDALAQSQPADVQSNVLFWTQYHGVLARLHEPALRMHPAPRSHRPPHSTARTEALSSCQQALSDFFAAYAKISLDSLSHMPLVATAYMAFAFVTSSRILMLSDADWDAGLARRTLNFPGICQDLSDRFRQADDLAQSLGRRRRFKDDGDGLWSVLTAYSTKIMWVRQWYLAKASAADGASGGVAEPTDGIPQRHIVSMSVSTGMDVNHLEMLPTRMGGAQLPLRQEFDDDFWNALLDPTACYSWDPLSR